MKWQNSFPRALALTACVALPTIVLPPLTHAQQSQDQEAGNYLESLLESALSAQGRNIDIIGLTGSLSSVATFDSMTISDATGVWLRLEEVALDWNRAALLSGRIDVNSLTAKSLSMPRLPQASPDAAGASLPTPEATPFALPDLPVSVDIGALTVADLSLGAAVLGQPVSFDLSGTMSLAEGAGAAALALNRIDGVTGAFQTSASFDNATQDVQIDLSLNEAKNGLLTTLLGIPDAPALSATIQGSGPISDLTTKVRLASDGVDRLAGTITLSQGADLNAQRLFAAELTGDMAPLFAPDYQAFFGDQISLTVAGSQQGDVTALEALDLQSGAARVRGSALFQAGWPKHIDLSGQIGTSDAAATLLPLPGTPTRVQLARFDVQHEAATSDEWRVSAEITSLDTAGLMAEAVTVTGSGQILGQQAAGKLALSLNGFQTADPALAQAVGSDVQLATQFSTGAAQPLRLTDLALTGADYRLTGAVDLLTQPSLTIQPDLQLSAADLSRFAGLTGQAIGGAGDLAIQGAVTPLEGSFDLRATGAVTEGQTGIAEVDALLAGRTKIDIGARRDGTGITLTPVALSNPQAEINGDAQIRSQGSRATLQARVNDLAVIGTLPTGPAKIAVQLAQQDSSVFDLNLKATAPQGMNLTGAFQLTDPMAATQQITGEAQLTAPDLAPYAALAGLPYTGGLTAGVSGTAWPQQQRFDLSLDGTGQNLAIGQDIADQLLAGGTDFAVAAQMDRGALRLRHLTLTSPEVTLRATESLPAQVTSEVAPDVAPASGQRLAGALSYQLSLRDLGVLGGGINGAVNGTGTARFGAERWDIDSRFSGPLAAGLSASGWLAPDFTAADMSLTGAVPLGLLNPLIQPRNLEGTANVDLRLAGAPALDALSGQIRMGGVRLALPNLRQALQDIGGTIDLNAGQARLNIAAAHVNGGRIGLTGPVSLSAGNRAALRLSADQVVVQDPSLYRAVIDGALSVDGPLTGGAAITGQLQLDQADLRIPAGAGPRFASLPGLQHRNEPGDVNRVRQWAGLIERPATSVAANYALDVTVTAPSRIFVRGRGLDAELGGTLRLGGSTQNILPDGQFELTRGRLDILGKRLTLTEGLVQLRGGLDPFLRFVAETQTDDILAGITIEGPASTPELRFTSSPDLPEDEVLSLLLFGRDITRISPLQAVRLAAAIRTLSGRGGDGVTGRLRQGLALDDLDVTTDDEGNTEARVGKYISDKIYTEVTADTAGNSQIDLNLQLSPTVKAKGRLGSDGSTGIGIFIEKDY